MTSRKNVMRPHRIGIEMLGEPSLVLHTHRPPRRPSVATHNPTLAPSPARIRANSVAATSGASVAIRQSTATLSTRSAVVMGLRRVQSRIEDRPDAFPIGGQSPVSTPRLHDGALSANGRPLQCECPFARVFAGTAPSVTSSFLTTERPLAAFVSIEKQRMPEARACD